MSLEQLGSLRQEKKTFSRRKFITGIAGVTFASSLLGFRDVSRDQAAIDETVESQRYLSNYTPVASIEAAEAYQEEEYQDQNIETRTTIFLASAAASTAVLIAGIRTASKRDPQS